MRESTHYDTDIKSYRRLTAACCGKIVTIHTIFCVGVCVGDGMTTWVRYRKSEMKYANLIKGVIL